MIICAYALFPCSKDYVLDRGHVELPYILLLLDNQLGG